VKRSDIVQVDEGEDISKWFVHLRSLTTQLKDASTQAKDNELQELKEKLHEAIQGKLNLQEEVQQVSQTIAMIACAPTSELENSWLALVQRL